MSAHVRVSVYVYALVYMSVSWKRACECLRAFVFFLCMRVLNFCACMRVCVCLRACIRIFLLFFLCLLGYSFVHVSTRVSRCGSVCKQMCVWSVYECVHVSVVNACVRVFVRFRVFLWMRVLNFCACTRVCVCVYVLVWAPSVWPGLRRRVSPSLGDGGRGLWRVGRGLGFQGHNTLNSIPHSFRRPLSVSLAHTHL